MTDERDERFIRTDTLLRALTHSRKWQGRLITQLLGAFGALLAAVWYDTRYLLKEYEKLDERLRKLEK